MIFSEKHINQIIHHKKTQTRRRAGHYREGGLYAVQSGRGKAGIPEGKICVGVVVLEFKWDTPILESGRFIYGWKQREEGYPISEDDAKAEGGYTPPEYEALYEKLHPGWTTRDALRFAFITAEELKEMGEK